ncbi:cation-translocating P-type ATPase [Crateriforma conspicua]|uniref:cation-translocating P-type ATPase n=1 Tax=Crateriforma conspicua TaxID=2527996 RepID=UPI00118C5CA7|nr:cation-transporting P-type ATPase [Crateriforma conspicua]QDV62408.1 Calcium-transporting ATPase [Crateriforma conspicua]
MNHSKIASVAFHASSIDEVTGHFDTSADTGLDQDDVVRRQSLYGPNRLNTETQLRWYRVLGRQFCDVLILVLAIAAGVSVAVGAWTDALTILAIVVLNALLGFAQEWKAERALQGLRRMLSPRCTVIRQAHEQTVDADEIVPGDLVVLRTGNRVPADLRLVRCVNLRIDESVLTGESGPVVKRTAPVDSQCPLAERASMAWMGTEICTGHARGIVVATADQTQFGNIASLTESVHRETTPLQHKLGRLGRQLGVAAVGIAAMVMLAGLWMQKPWLEMFLTGISLAVAVVPEGLPAVVTLTMALGVRAMVRRKALLRRLRAAESLGAATVVCTDKTGTLTKNEMTVTEIWLADQTINFDGAGYDPHGKFTKNDHTEVTPESDLPLRELLDAASRCSHARLEFSKASRESLGENGLASGNPQNDLSGDTTTSLSVGGWTSGGRWIPHGEPTESALIVAAVKAGLSAPSDLDCEVEFPFTSERKRMTVVQQINGGLIAFCKGAPEVILARCNTFRSAEGIENLTETKQRSVTQVYEEMAQRGLRTLAVATKPLADSKTMDAKNVESELTLLGIVGMMDSPRDEVPAAIQLAHQAGVKVIMITGDSPVTAIAVGRGIGLSPGGSVTGDQLNAMTDEQLIDAIDRNVVFARTTPENKLRIVNLLQKLGHVVAMTGDGVNDAPALKKADIGIAMGIRGTDVAKGAADMVLTDDNFSSIVGAIQEGRRQYDNILKFVRYLLSSNTGEVVAIFLNILWGGPLILLPVQILWMNLVTDGLTAVALGLEPANRSVMQRPPRRPDQSMVDRPGFVLILAIGIYIGIAALWIFHRYLTSGDPQSIAVAGTVAFTTIVLIEKVNVLNFRSLRSPIGDIGWFSNPWVLLAIVLTVGLQVCAVYIPVLQQALHTVALRPADWAIILVTAAPIFVFVEAGKWILARRVSVDRDSRH